MSLVYVRDPPTTLRVPHTDVERVSRGCLSLKGALCVLIVTKGN